MRSCEIVGLNKEDRVVTVIAKIYCDSMNDAVTEARKLVQMYKSCWGDVNPFDEYWVYIGILEQYQGHEIFGEERVDMRRIDDSETLYDSGSETS